MSTISTEERREMARRLRAAKRPSLMVLMDVLGVGGEGVFARLADLIEPGEPKAKCVAEVKVDGEQLEQMVHDATVELTSIDRDALLALADEMGRVRSRCDFCIKNSGCDWADETICLESHIDDYAQRIREALGVGR